MAALRFMRPLQALLKTHRSIFVVKTFPNGFINYARVNKHLCPYTQYLKRFQSTTTTEEEGNVTEPEKTKSWFVRWLHGEVPEPESVRTEEEIDERRILLEKVQEMYFSNPPKSPGADFYTEAFHLLIKYNDRIGVENLYEVMKEEKIDPGNKLIEEIESYITKAREEAWFK